LAGVLLLLDMMEINWWVVFGFLGQIVFFARVVVQWWVSEKQKKSVIPRIYWYLSITGSLIVLVYAVRQIDPVFIVGQVISLMVYARNLMFK